MEFIPHTAEQRKEMLAAIGLTMDDLFGDIPPELVAQSFHLPHGLSEQEVRNRLADLAGKNSIDLTLFLGGGFYDHFIPSAVYSITSRSEFYTAYTPYQPEISQGTLQAIFEFQTLICQLTGMDVANASLYDGASGLAEAVLMAGRAARKREVLISAGAHPHYRQAVQTYVQHQGYKLIEVPLAPDGRTDVAALSSLISPATAAVILQNPNFYGIVEQLDATAAIKGNALFICVVTDAMTLGLLKPPGECGADIVVGEAQAFGNAVSLGGPYVGFLAVRQNLVRNLPGRLVGQTVDKAGRRGFVLTLSTREQHIRREKATSNICTNQGLCALMASIHMAMLGRAGARETASQCLQKAHYLHSKLTAVPGVKALYSAPFFHEFVIELDRPAHGILAELTKKQILGGLPLARLGGADNQVLVCVTEVNTRQAMDEYAAAIAEALAREVAAHV